MKCECKRDWKGQCSRFGKRRVLGTDELLQNENWRWMEARRLVAVYDKRHIYGAIVTSDKSEKIVVLPSHIGWLDTLVALKVYSSKSDAIRHGEKEGDWPEHVFGERKFHKKNLAKTVWIGVHRPTN